jgi:hypothetical protein
MTSHITRPPTHTRREFMKGMAGLGGGLALLGLTSTAGVADVFAQEVR